RAEDRNGVRLPTRCDVERATRAARLLQRDHLAAAIGGRAALLDLPVGADGAAEELVDVGQPDEGGDRGGARGNLQPTVRVDPAGGRTAVRAPERGVPVRVHLAPEADELDGATLEPHLADGADVPNEMEIEQERGVAQDDLAVDMHGLGRAGGV